MAINNPKDLGAAVRAERLRRGLSQVAVSASAGVSGEWLEYLENGAPRLEMGKVLRILAMLGIEVLPRRERPTQADIAKAQRIAWTMSLEAQPLTDAGFQRILEKIVAHRLARTPA
jgi:transcriptional regulator with XRE-family HTH domain